MKRNTIAIEAPWIGYIRVSTKDQANSGLSLESQEARVRAAAVAKAVPLNEVIVDPGESAKDLNRPGMIRLRALIRNQEISGVIVVKADRLTRRLKDLWELVDELEQNNVALLSLSESFDTTTANGRLMLSFVGMIAQWEREITAERTSASLGALKHRGEHAGNVPYGFKTEGYKKDGGSGRMIEEPSEQAVIAAVKEMRENHVRMRKIADNLNQMGHKTRNGSKWRIQYVSRLLQQLQRLNS
jgi:site-specific DNA recombinase